MILAKEMEGGGVGGHPLNLDMRIDVLEPSTWREAVVDMSK